MCVPANFTDIYLRGMCDRSMRSGTELAQEIQLTDWSTAGELVFVVSNTSGNYVTIIKTSTLNGL